MFKNYNCKVPVNFKAAQSYALLLVAPMTYSETQGSAKHGNNPHAIAFSYPYPIHWEWGR